MNLLSGLRKKAVDESGPTPLISAEHLGMTYQVGDQEVRALQDVSLSIDSGEFVAIMGPSGSGKSTLLNLLGALDVPTSGRLFLNGENVATLRPNALADFRNQTIGFVFQQFNLLPRTSALRQVMLPLNYSRNSSARRGARNGVLTIEEKARIALEKVELSNRLDHIPSQLSGGQQQRVAIARALVNNPKLILADEPTGALDSETSNDIMRLFSDLNAQDMTIIVVTHDSEIAAFANRRILFRDGCIISDDQTAPEPMLEAI